MARRPDPTEFDTPLNKEDLAKRWRDLAMLSEHHVRDAYQEADDPAGCKVMLPLPAPSRNW